jgi:hypothetical protein
VNVGGIDYSAGAMDGVYCISSSSTGVFGLPAELLHRFRARAERLALVLLGLSVSGTPHPEIFVP